MTAQQWHSSSRLMIEFHALNGDRFMIDISRIVAVIERTRRGPGADGTDGCRILLEGIPAYEVQESYSDVLTMLERVAIR